MKREKKMLVLLLDFDGTLSQIVPRPEDAEIVRESKDALQKLAKNPRVYVGIISGRRLDDVRSRVNIRNIAYAGNHGLEIIFRNRKKKPFVYKLKPEISVKYKNLVKTLNASLANGRALVEDKGLTLTFHYRNTSDHDEFKMKATKIIESFDFTAAEAICAVEGRPKVDWNKGTTVKKLLKEEFTSKWAKKVKVIYAGDDTGDEPAMEVLKGKGLTFRVSNSSSVKTYADHRIESPEMITKILKFLVENL